MNKCFLTINLGTMIPFVGCFGLRLEEADAFSRKLMVNPSDDFLKAMKEEVGIEAGMF